MTGQRERRGRRRGRRRRGLGRRRRDAGTRPTGRESWSYTFTPASPGTHHAPRPRRRRQREPRDAGRPASRSRSRRRRVRAASGTTRVVPAGDPNQNDGQPLELGVKFRAATDGFVTALRFYKGALEHRARTSGTSGRAAARCSPRRPSRARAPSGWQQVALAVPVAVTAGTTYVASYHSSAGYYAFDVGYFSERASRTRRSARSRTARTGRTASTSTAPRASRPRPSRRATTGSTWCSSPTPASSRRWDDTATPGAGGRDRRPADRGRREVPRERGGERDRRSASTRAPRTRARTSATSGRAAARCSPTATFTDESASGWQTVSFASPVAARARRHLRRVLPLVRPASSRSTPATSRRERVAGPLRAARERRRRPERRVPLRRERLPGPDRERRELLGGRDLRARRALRRRPAGRRERVARRGRERRRVRRERDRALRRGDRSPRASTARASSCATARGALVAVERELCDAATRTATLDPAADLAPSTTYTATVKGGAERRARPRRAIRSPADFVWSFTTAAPPPPPPDEGPGGPILVVASAANPFGRYYAEILRDRGAERLRRRPTSRTLDAPLLAAHEVVILGEHAARRRRRWRCSRAGSTAAGSSSRCAPTRSSRGCSAWRRAAGTLSDALPRDRHRRGARRGPRRRDAPVPRHGRPLHARRRERARHALLATRPRRRRTPP